MEASQLQSEHEEEMSCEQTFSDDFNEDGHSFSHSRSFRQGGRVFAIPQQRLVVLSLGLLNAVLLLTAVVIGIYCAKAKDVEVAQSVATPLIVEMNHLRNISDIIRAKEEAQAALATERSSHLKLKQLIRQKKALTDMLQSQLETLYVEKSNLQANKSFFELSCGRCQPGWTLFNTSCYYFSPPESSKNWQDSRADCISKGGDLLVINSLEEQEFIADNCPRVSGSTVWWEGAYWIGLTHMETQGTWVWINNVTEVSTAYWGEREPDFSGPLSKNCAATYPHISQIKMWLNRNCQTHLLKWICERDMIRN
ncbi:CD209 antigen-like protein A isoform X2 [Parambassis ranga]|uniref:CD209 antigen-like protein A isoform X2 n=1 Tax=Parambassis ranga TaxID=210632 RepID=A0A6P7HCJ3_9TELE|nr:CD209 antigen-like protein A isoform X2 [Parambassis ranga]